MYLNTHVTFCLTPLIKLKEPLAIIIGDLFRTRVNVYLPFCSITILKIPIATLKGIYFKTLLIYLKTRMTFCQSLQIYCHTQGTYCKNLGDLIRDSCDFLIYPSDLLPYSKNLLQYSKNLLP